MGGVPTSSLVVRTERAAVGWAAPVVCRQVKEFDGQSVRAVSLTLGEWGWAVYQLSSPHPVSEDDRQRTDTASGAGIRTLRCPCPTPEVRDLSGHPVIGRALVANDPVTGGTHERRNEVGTLAYRARRPPGQDSGVSLSAADATARPWGERRAAWCTWSAVGLVEIWWTRLRRCPLHGRPSRW